MSDETNPTGWVKMYHSSGAQVTIPISLSTAIDSNTAYRITSSLESLLAAGLTVNMPGLENGENIEEIGWALRKKQKNDRGESIRMELYPASPRLVKKCLIIYLDTPEQLKDFETATGLQVRSMPIYVGKDSPERGQDEATDQFIIKTPKVARAVWAENPAFDPTETDINKKKQKRLLVRWDGITPAKATARPAMTAEQAALVKVPSGALVSSLPEDKLQTLAHGTADWITQDMRDAAEFYLQNKKVS